MLREGRTGCDCEVSRGWQFHVVCRESEGRSRVVGHVARGGDVDGRLPSVFDQVQTFDFVFQIGLCLFKWSSYVEPLANGRWNTLFESGKSQMRTEL